MSFLDFFKPAPSITPDEVREYIDRKKPDEYCLLDVRQPKEYEEGHLPGARLFPLGELSLHMNALDRGKTTIVYCRSGNRSLSATSLLMNAGFRNVLNMEGGILRYNGIMASGPPEAGMFCFPESLSPGQLTAVAWFLENGTIAFLEGTRDRLSRENGLTLLDERITARSGHRKTLEKLYSDITGAEPSEDFPRDVIDIPAEDVMVGCVKISAALQWAEGKTLSDVLELMISLGANAYDLYLKLGRAVTSEEARTIFDVLSQEELKNVQYIASAYEKTI